MSGDSYDVGAHGLEPDRIRRHRDGALTARAEVFRALAGAGVPAERADDLVAVPEAGAVAGARTWIAESGPPAGPSTASWAGGRRVCAVVTGLSRLADQAAARPPSPLRQPGAAAPEGTAPAPVPGAQEVLEVARRCTGALTDPERLLVPDSSKESALVALGTVREDEQGGCVRHGFGTSPSSTTGAWRRCCARTNC